MKEFVESWIEESAYCRSLGVTLSEISAERAVLKLPFNEANANPGGPLHGGVAASLCVMASQAVARRALGEPSGPWHTAGLQVNYLAAAVGEDVEAEAVLLRRGRELCFTNVNVRTTDGKPIANATTTVRARQGKPSLASERVERDEGIDDPGPMKERLQKNTFISGRGIAPEFMRDGVVRFKMPYAEVNADSSGGVHEGAALALLDTAGAMCTWSLFGAGAFRASTPSIQAQFICPPGGTDLIAYGRVVQRDDEFYWNQVSVVDASNDRLVAQGTVLYRFLG